jgi:predicted nucleotidyltransferase
MSISSYSEVDPLIEELASNIRLIIGEKLLGLYLHGSLVWGDFDPQSSDIDLWAALTSIINDLEFEQLKQMHKDFALLHNQWDDRVEVCYISVDALKTVKSRKSQIVNISPGEPIHRLKINKEWLMKWYLLRERSKILFGPSPDTMIETISKDEFIQCIKDHVQSWGRWLQEMPHDSYALSYAVLTLCRALYSCKTGEQTSKKQAAQWAQLEIPVWSGLILEAMQWKKAGRNPELDEISFQKVAEFVNVIQKLILKM